MLKVHSWRWRCYAALCNAPWLLVLLYLACELLERLWRLYEAPPSHAPGTLPEPAPRVCVQVLLGAQQDGATAARVIDAACGLRWPHYRLEARAGAAMRAACRCDCGFSPNCPCALCAFALRLR
jgi:hypothetical protein